MIPRTKQIGGIQKKSSLHILSSKDNSVGDTVVRMVVFSRSVVGITVVIESIVLNKEKKEVNN